ncbi:MAG TPA: ABC transporter permease subunit [Candidatus Bathyarchaeia archaeon]|nr:ABC transporter permease subunit [Candidatus Bathyarchaeia archaeon]
MGSINKGWLKVLGVIGVIFFLLFVLIPSVYVLLYPLKDWKSIESVIFNRPTFSLILQSLAFSFKVAFCVTLFDLFLGILTAWVLARYDFWGKTAVKALIKLPLSVPTSALGFSVVYFWLQTGLSFSPFLLVALVHLAFSSPYIIGSLVVAFEELNLSSEEAARVLGASSLTAARTVTLPLIKERIALGTILTFARSLSETGATIIALTTIGSRLKTAPVLIASWKQTSGTAQFMAVAVVISAILILISWFLFLMVKHLSGKTGAPCLFYQPKLEHFLSRKSASNFKNILVFSLLTVVIIIPSFFILSRFRLLPLDEDSLLIDSLISSILIAVAATIINLISGLFLAFLIARSRFRHLNAFLETLVDFPLIIPTSVLGFSLALYWQGVAANLPLFVLIILAHLAFTFPYIVKPLVVAFRNTRSSFEEAARMLGGSPATVFKTVTLPLVVPTLESSAIMAFTRSLSETGATMSVAPRAITAPVYIVNLVTSGRTNQAAFASVILILFSFLFFLVTGKFIKSKSYL